MRYVIALIMLSVATPAFADRSPPPTVQPLEYNGVRYSAPNSSGRVAWLEARRIDDNTLLWRTEVFRNRINPSMEEDVQYVFIETLQLVDGKIAVTDEKGKTYFVDCQWGVVESSPELWLAIVFLLVLVIIVVGICVFVRWAKGLKRGRS
jgi:hypothetical protein